MRNPFQTALLWGLANACAPEAPAPTVWEDCADAACRLAFLTADWRAGDEPRTLERIAKISDPTEALLAVDTLIKVDPAHADRLCGALPPGSRDTCRQNTSRPHLNTRPPPPRRQARTAPGPASGTLSIPPSVRGAFHDLSPATGPCEADPRPRDCWTEAALVSAGAATLEVAAAQCAAISEEKWLGECAMRVAETAASHAAPPPYLQLLDLCLLVRGLEGRCVDRVHDRLASTAPLAGQGNWAEPVALAASVETAWKTRHPPLTDLALAGLWTHQLEHAYAEASCLTAEPTIHLPEAGHPHVRSALAARLVELAPGEPATLSAWQGQLDLALAQPPGACLGAHRSPAATKRPRLLWRADGPEEGALPALLYGESDRRMFSDDPDEDAKLALIEALARDGEGHPTLLRQALDSESALVRRCAMRLIERLRRK